MERMVSFEEIDRMIAVAEERLKEADSHMVRTYLRGVLFGLHAVKGEYEDEQVERY